VTLDRAAAAPRHTGRLRRRIQPARRPADPRRGRGGTGSRRSTSSFASW
jgi:hypothetical protein